MPSKNILPPPLPKLRQRILSWFKTQFKKEPIGSIALLITIVSICIPLFKVCYYMFLGPSYGAIVEFIEPLSPEDANGIYLSIENYSDIPIQAVQALISSSTDTIISDIQRSQVIFGSIPATSISSRERISFITHRPGKGMLFIHLSPYSNNSNVKPKLEIIDIAIPEWK